MSRSDCRNCSGRATTGSYSTSACSCVRLTATLSTPGSRPSAFSMVPVQSEQWRPPIRARILRRSGRVEGSSLQGWKAEMVAAELVIGFSHLVAFTQRFASHNPKAWPLDRIDEAALLNGLRVIEDASSTFAE